MRRMRCAVLTATVLTAAVLTSLVACTGPRSGASVSAGSAAPSQASSATAGSRASYLDQVNTLCDRLEIQEQAVVASFPPHFPVAQFLADDTKIQALVRSFDARLAAVPVRPAEQSTATAFAAYVKESTATRRLRVAAAHRGQQAYDAEYDRQIKVYAADPGLEAIDRLGFSGSCHYR
jgi:hypothetical protein